MKRKYPQSTATTDSTIRRVIDSATTEHVAFSQDVNAKDGKDDNDDIIDDDYDLFDEIFSHHILNDKITLHQSRETPDSQNQIIASPQRASNYTRKSSSLPQRFIISYPPDVRPQQSCSLSQEKGLPWVQQFPPSNLDELAVHKKKVSDVKNWLVNSFHRSGRQLLVLRGPAGSGKTTTISLLSKVLDFDILEWKNPSTSELVTTTHISAASRFEEFLGRGNEFGGLDLSGVNGSPVTVTDDRIASTSKRRIILIEEYPTLTGQSTNLPAFRLTLQKCLSAKPEQAKTESGEPVTSPIVIIVSETLLDSQSSQSDKLTVHRLLGPELYNHPRTSIIDFNAIAPTIMYKALNLVLEKKASISDREAPPSSAILHSISKIGDIRSAISSLQFLCLKSEDFQPANTSISAVKSKRGRTTLTSIERETLQLVTQREASLGLFHAVGKVVYNKRADVVSMTGRRPVLPPEHLTHHGRPQLSQVCVNELVDETGTDYQTFVSTLHENYVPSCNGSSFTEYLDGCISALSDSDVLSPRLQGQRRPWGSVDGTGVDILRQNDISYQVAALGILFALPCPVMRSTPSKKGLGHTISTYSMFFPTSLRLIRDREEIQGLVSLWSSRLLDQFSWPKFGSMVGASGSLSGAANRAANGNHGIESKMVLTRISRNDLILHQLPYLSMLTICMESSKELKRITEIAASEFQTNAMENKNYESDGLSFMTPGVNRRYSLLKGSALNAHQRTSHAGLQPLLALEGIPIPIDDDIIDEI
ncbi:hypothetical protein BO70DRAFT_366546 [Aspergillus heteromorphus CBS 117.55]|uniref:Checkpoint protein RAD24-like helical bundle domain-containing protein n=1 Tax=Aspergillus heteromorphus CBS 117.55 TaxID=1448321 RepID=A0A317UYK4_9EURO|nr:uncharacterized protein BO70DRAFT_366546 [Aspergillus heteromorphus CBS 117.55]PWY66341.1 hypothetical protein BO70DRAFT_366546 [Aspergillus heteromorphus CBS 117.55]